MNFYVNILFYVGISKKWLIFVKKEDRQNVVKVS